ncbi:MAG: hypothetical protein ACE5IO_02000 [Thermoplasmata archaeon]
MRKKDILGRFLKEVTKELWCIDAKTRQSTVEEIRMRFLGRARSLAMEKGLESPDEETYREAMESFGTPKDVARKCAKGRQKGLGFSVILYFVFLAMTAGFSIVHGFGSSHKNWSNIVGYGLSPGESEFAIYLSSLLVHGLRAVLGILLFVIVSIALRQPLRLRSSEVLILGLAIVIVVFDAIAITGMIVHRTAYGSDPLLEWSAINSFATWLMLGGLILVFLGHQQIRKFKDLLVLSNQFNENADRKHLP